MILYFIWDNLPVTKVKLQVLEMCCNLCSVICLGVINPIAQIFIGSTSEIENQVSEQIPAIGGAALVCVGTITNK